MENQFFDVESLENLTYERSKTWAKELEDMLARDEGEEVHINDFDEIFAGEEDSDDSDETIEEAIEDDVLEDITNHTSNAQRTTNSGNINKRNGALMLYVGENEKDQEDFQELVDQTLPILVEHKRKWEKAGIERVLKTFDVKKIEEEVGDWLRCNNKSFIEKSMCSFTSPHSFISPENERRMRYNKNKDINRDESDVESMHSVDTARYIRSSRKQHGLKRSFSSQCTTMTIKTYRMVKSKRDELREKYECPEYDDDHRRRLQKMRCQRLQEKRQRDCEDSHHVSKKNLRSFTDRCYNNSQRRKMLRKRRSNSFTMHSSSEDSCEDSLMMHDISAGYSTSKLSRYGIASHETVLRRGSSQKNECMRNLHQLSRKERTMHRQYAVDVDHRPYKRESECRCCNDKKLCRNVRHLASRSTEEWLVENDDVMNDSNANQDDREFKKTLQLKQKERKTDKQVSFQSGAKPKKQSVNSSCFKDDAKGTEPDNKEKPNLKKEKKPLSLHSEKKSSKMEISLNSSDNSMKRLRKSKRKKNCRIDSDTSTEKRSDPIKNKAKIVKSSSKSKLSKVAANNKSVEEDKDNFENELKLALKLSKETYEIEQKNKELKTLKETEMTKNNKKLHSKKSIDKMETTTNKLVIDNTFFANNSQICNSTACIDDVAKNREFTPNRKAVKRAAAVSTTLLQNNSSLSSGTSTTSTTAAHNSIRDIKKQKKTKKHNIESDDNDCTIVSSTTGAEVSQPQESFIAKPTQKGIVLYAPHNRKMVPENSFQNGYFNITESHLSSVLGATVARKFLKTYIGRRRFNTSSTVYYRPPSSSNRADSESKTIEPLAEDSASDDDIFDVAGRYGVLYESLEKHN